MKYDSEIIEQHAEALYSAADWVVFKYSFFGLFLGGVIGAIAARVESGSIGVVGLIGALIGCAIGYSMGRARAFQYRLQAQMALCQVQIEENTNRAAPAPVEELAAKEAEAPPSGAPGVDAKEQMGRCPNCETVIPLNASTCRKCTAQFGGRNLWKVKPL